MAPSSHELIRQVYRAFAERDHRALRQLALPDVEIRTMTGVMAGRQEPYTGYGGLAAYLRDVDDVWDELQLTASEFHDLDTGEVLVFGRVRGRRGSTLVDSSSAWLWSLRDGRVASARVFADADTAMALLDSKAE